MKIVIVSGFFNPLHFGHLKMIRDASKMGDHLVVVVNNDNQQLIKKGKIIMGEEDRMAIISELRSVDEVILSIDNTPSVSSTIQKIVDSHPGDDFIFANGGDRICKDDIRESDVCDRNNIQLAFNVGGEKITSSSDILTKSLSDQMVMQRDWGYWVILGKDVGYKVKRLSVLPGRCLSYQRHKYRDEHWIVVRGEALVVTSSGNEELMPGDSYYIPRTDWHQLINNSRDTLEVIEVSTGSYIEEDDIERK